MDLVQSAVLLGFGALLTLLGQELARYRARQDRREDREYAEAAARRAEISRRSDAAAAEAVTELEQVDTAFRGRWRHDDHPDAADLDPLLRNLQRCVLFISDSKAQERMTLAVRLLGQVDTIEQHGGGGLPPTIAGVLTQAVREVLSATLQGRSLPPVPEKVTEYHAAVEDHYAIMQEMREEDARDRRGRAKG